MKSNAHKEMEILKYNHTGKHPFWNRIGRPYWGQTAALTHPSCCRTAWLFLLQRLFPIEVKPWGCVSLCASSVFSSWWLVGWENSSWPLSSCEVHIFPFLKCSINKAFRCKVFFFCFVLKHCIKIFPGVRTTSCFTKAAGVPTFWCACESGTQ